MSAGTIQIGLRESISAFRPGDEIAGAVHWERKGAPQSAELRLCWFTRGKGTEDAGVLRTVSFDQPLAGDMRTFSFPAPLAPYSFSGRLISLIWALELVLKPGKDFHRVEIVIAPGAREVVLPAIPA